MTELFNRKQQTEKRRILRNNMPASEIILWSKLKNKQLGGHKFRRQYSVGSYILDFYCPALHLAIEIDGDSHFVGDAPECDRERQTYIESLGIKFLRFSNEEIKHNLLNVLETISCEVGIFPLLTKEGIKGRLELREG